MDCSVIILFFEYELYVKNNIYIFQNIENIKGPYWQLNNCLHVEACTSISRQLLYQGKTRVSG